jgi:putative iron-regulated protein
MKLTKLSKVIGAAIFATALTACVEDGKDGQDGSVGADGTNGTNGTNGVSVYVETADVVKTNANIAYAAYSDSLVAAQTLKVALEDFVAEPTEANFKAAKQAWLDSREPYGQTEVYRFRVGPIDALKEDGTMGEEGDGPEGKINAWPLGEALIDYVADEVDGEAGPESPGSLDDAKLSGTNIIANTAEYPTINKATLEGLFEEGEDERNVTTGYHAIEFLLWGQDLNLTGPNTEDDVRDATAGHRPVSDFSKTVGSCTSGSTIHADTTFCERRGDYLVAAAELLIDNLQAVTEQWSPSGTNNHYASFIAGGKESLGKILEGMGRLSFGELAGERINIALRTDSQEDEHSCFSDNTHRDIFLNAKGVQNSFAAKYQRIDGEVIEGASIYDLLVVAGEYELANTLRGDLEATMAAAAVIDTKAKLGMPFDTLINGTSGLGDINQPDVKAVIAALVKQTDTIEQAMEALEVTAVDLEQDTEEEIGS